MLGKVNPRQMQKMMKQMGISQKEIEAEEVIIKCRDREIIIRSPEVSKVNMMGQETFQISGEIEEKELSSDPETSEEDIQLVMEQASCTREEAEKAIKENEGDIAKAILSLKSED